MSSFLLYTLVLIVIVLLLIALVGMMAWIVRLFFRPKHKSLLLVGLGVLLGSMFGGE